MRTLQIASALEAVARSLSIADCQLGKQGGGPMILAAAFGIPVMDSTAKRLVLSALADCQDLGIKPQAQLDPLGYCIVENCWWESAKILGDIGRSFSESRIQQILEEARWNPVYKPTISDTLEIIATTCRESNFFEAKGAHRDAILTRILSRSPLNLNSLQVALSRELNERAAQVIYDGL